jgi:(R,R)-butanediol dehydrogenase/meso-butanediol dehydrogenase/diacetyl reductase
MRALMKVAPVARAFELREAAVATVGDDEVLIRVAGCGICGSDLTVYNQGPDDFARLYPATLPRIVGHEFSGEIVEKGPGVGDLEVGQWVAVSPHVNDGTCDACLRGQEELCENRPLYGTDRPGGAAEFVAVRASNAYRLAESVARTVGPLAEPLAVGLHAVERLPPERGDVVVVFGAGPIGLLIGVACQEAGVDAPFLVGLPQDEERLRRAEAIGLRAFCDLAALETAVREATRGNGADVVYEAAGASAAVEAGVRLVRAGGTVGVLGLPHHPIALADPFDFVLGEKSLIGIRAYTPRTWQMAVKVLAARERDLASLVTHRLPLAEWREGFALAGTPESVKVVLDCTA